VTQKIINYWKVSLWFTHELAWIFLKFWTTIKVIKVWVILKEFDFIIWCNQYYQCFVYCNKSQINFYSQSEMNQLSVQLWSSFFVIDSIKGWSILGNVLKIFVPVMGISGPASQLWSIKPPVKLQLHSKSRLMWSWLMLSFG
jgi:hypothetical protein